MEHHNTTLNDCLGLNLCWFLADIYLSASNLGKAMQLVINFEGQKKSHFDLFLIIA
jgi:hypothetical protein